MLTLTFALLAIVALALLTLVRAVQTAPVGFEDAEGFHAVRDGRVQSAKSTRSDERAALARGVLAAS